MMVGFCVVSGPFRGGWAVLFHRHYRAGEGFHQNDETEPIGSDVAVNLFLI